MGLRCHRVDSLHLPSRMDTLQGVISDLRVFLYAGFQSLPLCVAGTFLIIGLFTSNYAMLFFLAGFLIAVPILHFGLDLLLRLILPTDWVHTTSDVCRIIVPFTNTASATTSQVTSQWMAMMLFFIGYMIRNGGKLMTREPEPTAGVELTETQVMELDRKASYRKAQAFVSLLTLVIVAAVLLIVRYRTGCESILGGIVSLGFGVGGYYWYELLSAVGQDRLSDLFGVANRLLPPDAIVNGPVMCFPT